MASKHDKQGLEAATIEAALTNLRADPGFVAEFEGITERVKAALVDAGVANDRIEIVSGGATSRRDGASERVPEGYWCLLTLFDECWFSVKVH